MLGRLEPYISAHVDFKWSTYDWGIKQMSRYNLLDHFAIQQEALTALNIFDNYYLHWTICIQFDGGRPIWLKSLTIEVIVRASL